MDTSNMTRAGSWQKYFEVWRGGFLLEKHNVLALCFHDKEESRYIAELHILEAEPALCEQSFLSQSYHAFPDFDAMVADLKVQEFDELDTEETRRLMYQYGMDDLRWKDQGWVKNPNPSTDALPQGTKIKAHGESKTQGNWRAF